MNTAIGLVISVIANQLVFPRFGLPDARREPRDQLHLHGNLDRTRVRVASFFNARLQRAAQRMAKAVG
jgi:hypothetical protein